VSFFHQTLRLFSRLLPSILNSLFKNEGYASTNLTKCERKISLINGLSCSVSRQGVEERAYIELEKIYSELMIEI